MKFLQINGSSKASPNVKKRIIICLLVLGTGLGGMAALASLKKPPAEAAVGERPILIEAELVQKSDFPVSITGYGEVQARNTVSIAPEVAGKVVAVHPRLEVGEIIPAGEVLFSVDTRNYDTARKEAQATVRQLKNSVLRLEKQQAIDMERLKTAQRNSELAKLEFERVKELFGRDDVGTRSGVDRAEQTYNSVKDQADQMAQAVVLYPIRIKEAQAGLSTATARQERSGDDLDRCTVTAPFTGRIKGVMVEEGQYAAPGQHVVTIVDDSMLEINVSLDSRDARKWLQFEDAQQNAAESWFSGLRKVDCEISWTEDKEGKRWKGQLHRVVKFDPQTRTLTVAVRVLDNSGGDFDGGRLPLVEGMFCSVSIPGKNLKDVIQLPRWAVSFENTVYTVVDNRLKTVPVEVIRIENGIAYVNAGLNSGDRVVTTRLVDPLESSLLKITNMNGEGQTS